MPPRRAHVHVAHSIEALTGHRHRVLRPVRFAHVFRGGARARAPGRAHRLISGVESVSTRVVKTAVLDVPGFEEPVHRASWCRARARRARRINRLACATGAAASRAPRARCSWRAFAEAHGLRTGDASGHQTPLAGTDRGGPGAVTRVRLHHRPGALMPDDQRLA